VSRCKQLYIADFLMYRLLLGLLCVKVPSPPVPVDSVMPCAPLSGSDEFFTFERARVDNEEEEPDLIS